MKSTINSMVELDEIGEESGGAEISFREHNHQFLFKKTDNGINRSSGRG
jgi:hypothetical protein